MKGAAAIKRLITSGKKGQKGTEAIKRLITSVSFAAFGSSFQSFAEVQVRTLDLLAVHGGLQCIAQRRVFRVAKFQRLQV